MSLEDAAEELQDQLLPGLSFRLPDAANYVNGRVSSTFFPQGSAYYRSSGTRLIRFVIADPNLVDLSTIRLSFLLKNEDNAKTLAITPPVPMAMFQRIRIYVGGTLVEDILMSGRLAGLLDRMKSVTRRWSDALSYGVQDTNAPAVSVQGANPGTVAQYPDSSILRGPLFLGMAAGGEQRIITPILSGLLATHWWLPTKFAPVTIELELVNSPAQCCARGGNLEGGAAAWSQDFSLSDVRLLADVCTVDNSVMEELSRVLLEGGALPMHFTSYANTMHTLTLQGESNQSFAVTHARSFSRIKSIFLTFDSPDARGIFNTEHSLFLNWHGRDNYDDYYGAGGSYNSAFGEGWRFQFATGSLLVPQIPMSSSAEAWYSLSKTLGMHASLESVSIPPSEWLSRSFCIALDLEKAAASPGAGASYSGLSTMDAGSTMRFSFENVNCRNPESRPQTMHLHIHHDAILEIRAAGVVLLT
jgi:hypothetical protein